MNIFPVKWNDLEFSLNIKQILLNFKLIFLLNINNLKYFYENS